MTIYSLFYALKDLAFIRDIIEEGGHGLPMVNILAGFAHKCAGKNKHSSKSRKIGGPERV